MRFLSSKKTTISKLYINKQRRTVANIQEAIKYYHKALHLGCCSSARSTSDKHLERKKLDFLDTSNPPAVL